MAPHYAPYAHHRADDPTHVGRRVLLALALPVATYSAWLVAVFTTFGPALARAFGRGGVAPPRTLLDALLPSHVAQEWLGSVVVGLLALSTVAVAAAVAVASRHTWHLVGVWLGAVLLFEVLEMLRWGAVALPGAGGFLAVLSVSIWAIGRVLPAPSAPAPVAAI